jgi:hypothetical protein
LVRAKYSIIFRHINLAADKKKGYVEARLTFQALLVLRVPLKL